jgi:CRP-like cAMP-binding protein
MKKQESTHLLLLQKVLLLKELSLFRDTPETILAEMAEILEEVDVQEGDDIVKEGEIGSGMYIIYKGEVKIHKSNHLLATFKEKDFFGELALLDTEKRSATATAVKDCLLYYIDQTPFYQLMQSRPEVVKGIVQILCRRIRAANELIMDLKGRLNG